jgi:hypothetical protein
MDHAWYFAGLGRACSQLSFTKKKIGNFFCLDGSPRWVHPTDKGQTRAGHTFGVDPFWKTYTFVRLEWIFR